MNPISSFANYKAECDTVCQKQNILGIIRRFEAIHISEEEVDKEEQCSCFSTIFSFLSSKDDSEEEIRRLSSIKFKPMQLGLQWKNRLQILERKLQGQLSGIKQVLEQDAAEQTRLKAKLLALQEEFEITRHEITAFKCQILKEMNSVLIDVAEQKHLLSEVNKLQRQFEQNLRQANEDLTRVQRQVQNEFTQMKANTEVEEAWHLSSWGQLIVQSNSLLQDLSHALGLSFKATVDQLENIKRDLKQRLSTTEGPEKDELQQSLNEVERQVYQALLLRIIDVIGEKKRLSKEAEPQSGAILEKDLDTLNAGYRELMDKFRRIPARKRSFWEALGNEFTEKAQSLIGLGYWTGRSVSTEEILRRKYYADSGYSMKENVKKWLDTLQVPEDTSWQEVLKKEVGKFLEWADKHPETAITLAGDIALSCAILRDDDYVQWFKQTMTAKAYAYAFLRALGPTSKTEPIDKDEFKYRALADLSRYAPIMLGAGKEFQKSILEGKFGIVDLLFKPGIAALKTSTVQQIASFIPNEHAKLAKAAAEIFQGQDFQEILNNQLKIDLIRQAGAIKDLLIHPSEFFEKFEREIILWWNTILRATGEEKLWRIGLQVVTPLAGLAAAIGLVAASMTGASVSFGTAILLGWLILNLVKGVYGYAEIFLSYHQTRKNVEDEMKETFELKDKAKREHMKHMLLTNKKATRLVTCLRQDFINKVIANKRLPVVATPNDLKLKETWNEKQVADMTKDMIVKFTEGLNTEEAKIGLISAPERGVTLFKQVVSLDRLHLEIQNVIRRADPNVNDDQLKELEDWMTHRIYNELISGWLAPKIEQAFIENFLDLAKHLDSETEFLARINEEQQKMNPRARLISRLEKQQFISKDIDQLLQGLDQFSQAQALNEGPSSNYPKMDWARIRIG